MIWRFLLLAVPACILSIAGAAAGRVSLDRTNPKVLHRVEPRYTREARANGIQGTVLLEVVVDETGKPAEVSVLSPIGFGLDGRAVDAVKQWTFQPGMKAGHPVDEASPRSK